MNAQASGETIAGIAAAISEPSRVRMLYSLLDKRARTSTELAVVAEVSASTASAHLSRLSAHKLVKNFRQGKHRYYSLAGRDVASALEALNLVAAGARTKFVPATPARLLAARSCYDHIAGSLGVALNVRFKTLGWVVHSKEKYELTSEGTTGFGSLGIDLDAARAMRRKFAYPCLDWSERQPHLAGSLGAALLEVLLKRKWVVQDLDDRALSVTSLGRREMLARLGLQV